MMSCNFSFRPRRTSFLFKDGEIRHAAVDYHRGDYHDFLRRHHKAAAHAVEQGQRGLREIAPFLFKRVADTRALRLAWDHLASQGGETPGPSGLRYEDFDDLEVWRLLRGLGESIREKQYRPDADRVVKIPKVGARGTRTLRIQSIEDRVVARAIVEIIQPLLDPGFSEYSFGFRPGRDRLHALATALKLVEDKGLLVCVVEDVRDAFDQVPRQRLYDVLRRVFPDDLMELIQLLTDTGDRRGIRQGSPLSPLLLNVYLDHFLDRAWKKRVPQTPLLRTADDILVLCRTQQEALARYSVLEEVLLPAGMPLKGTLESSIIDLAEGGSAEWLGFKIRQGDTGLEVGVAERAWEGLSEHLALTQTKPNAPLRAIESIFGWVDQLGPCYPHLNQRATCGRIRRIAHQHGFDEVPEVAELRRLWQTAFARWCRLRKRLGKSPKAYPETPVSCQSL